MNCNLESHNIAAISPNKHLNSLESCGQRLYCQEINCAHFEHFLKYNIILIVGTNKRIWFINSISFSSTITVGKNLNYFLKKSNYRKNRFSKSISSKQFNLNM